MEAPVFFNSLMTKEDSVLDAVTTAPDKGIPTVDKLSYIVMGPLMFLFWQFEEGITPAGGNFTVVAATDVCTLTTHGMYTGQLVQVTTDGVLPGGLAVTTDYYAIVIDANTFYLASSLTNARAGTRINITTAGTGTHTVTPETTEATAGTGKYLLTVPGGYEIDPNWVNTGSDAHGNLMGNLSISDGAGDVGQGNPVAYSATQIALAIDGVLQGSDTTAELGAGGDAVKISLFAILPLKDRNYQY